MAGLTKGYGTLATLWTPADRAAAADGPLLIADTGNNVLRFGSLPVDTASGAAILFGDTPQVSSQAANTGYASFASAWVIPAQQLDAAVSAPTANSSDDGSPNLFKYALGTDPLTAYPLPPGLTQKGGNWVFRYTRPVGLTAVTYGVETTTNRVTWAPLTTSLVSSFGSTETLRATLPAKATPATLVRLRVLAP